MATRLSGPPPVGLDSSFRFTFEPEFVPVQRLKSFALAGSLLCGLSVQDRPPHAEMLERYARLPARAITLLQKPVPDEEELSRVRATVWYETLERRVFLEWEARAENTLSSPRVAFRHNYRSESHPTAVEALDGRRLLVAGVSQNGSRVSVELWTFRQPVLQADSAAQTLVGAGRVSVRRIYDEPISKAGPIRALLTNLDGPESCFVFFDGSRELASMDTDSGKIKVLASPDSGVPRFDRVPELRFHWDRGVAITHKEYGYVYFFQRLPDPEEPDESDEPQPVAPQPRSKVRWLILLDRDRDGRLDHFFALEPVVD
jgi:hypothetical protein